jgi:acyl CoA:acetate/3-ketoacid CoA transferase beta subunit
VSSLSYPTSGIRPASMVVTEKAVFTFEDGRMILQEMAEDTTLDEIRQTTDARFEISADLKNMPC